MTLPEQASAQPQAILPPRAAKSASAYRTISEVATELGLPQHVLRFWETKFPSIKPLKRGGGRRYYRPEDIVLLRRIRDLLYAEGYTIKGVQKLLRQNGTRLEIVSGPPANGESHAAPAPAQPAVAAPPAPSPYRAKRAELRKIVDELESLRQLLRDAR